MEVSLTGEPNPRIIYNSLSSSIGEISYDWLTKNIFWADYLFEKIVMAPVYGAEFFSRTVVLVTPDKPTGLALYPPNG